MLGRSILDDLCSEKPDKCKELGFLNFICHMKNIYGTYINRLDELKRVLITVAQTSELDLNMIDSKPFWSRDKTQDRKRHIDAIEHKIKEHMNPKLQNKSAPKGGRRTKKTTKYSGKKYSRKNYSRKNYSRKNYSDKN